MSGGDPDRPCRPVFARVFSARHEHAARHAATRSNCGKSAMTYPAPSRPMGSNMHLVFAAIRSLLPAISRPWLVPLLAAAIVLSMRGGAPAQSNPDAAMAGRGKDVSFPVSCGDGAQPRFEAALAALHSFWYGQSLKEFTALAQANPDCAMAHWGVAMSLWNQLWAPPRPNNLAAGRAAIETARGVGSKSQREADYIDALATFYVDADKLDHPTRTAAYARQMEQVARRYPDDREARIFYALSLLA